MRSALPTALLLICATAQRALAGTPEPPGRAELTGTWQCSIESIQPDLTARMEWLSSFTPDGRFDSQGNISIRPKDWTYSIALAVKEAGTWSISNDRLFFKKESNSLTNITQPEGMNEEETAALRERLDQEMNFADLQQNLLSPSSSPILELSSTRLAILDEDSRDVFECRPTERTPTQAR